VDVDELGHQAVSSVAVGINECIWIDPSARLTAITVSTGRGAHDGSDRPLDATSTVPSGVRDHRSAK
jgi:hypothetical protein